MWRNSPKEILMKLTTRKLLVAGLAGVSLLAAGAVVAGGPACDGHGSPRHASFNPQERADRHLSELKSDLKLQPAQEAAWNAFVAAAQEQSKSMGRARDEMHGKTLTAPERMELASKFANEREQGIAKVSQAVEALYEVLTPEQRKVLDQQHGGLRHGHGMHS
jgi:Spy/CpxP family protein refolding chaperone